MTGMTQNLAAWLCFERALAAAVQTGNPDCVMAAADVQRELARDPVTGWHAQRIGMMIGVDGSSRPSVERAVAASRDFGVSVSVRMMVERGTLTKDQAAAAAEIRFAIDLGGQAGWMGGAVDPTRERVDGGGASRPTFAVGMEACGRYRQFLVHLRGTALWELRGKHDRMDAEGLFRLMLCQSDPIRDVERRLGLRSGSCATWLGLSLDRHVRLFVDKNKT